MGGTKNSEVQIIATEGGENSTPKPNTPKNNNQNLQGASAMTPKTQGRLLGAKSKTKSQFKFKSGIATEAMNKDPKDVPVTKTGLR